MNNESKKNVCAIDIDIINDFMTSDGILYNESVEGIKENIKIITEILDNVDIKIISLCDKHYGDEKHKFGETELKVNGGVFDLHAADGTEGAEKIPESLTKFNVARISTDINDGIVLENIISDNKQIIIEKQAICALYDEKTNPGGNPYFEHILDMMNIDIIIVYGVYTEYCINDNILKLLDRDIDVYLIYDAITGFHNDENTEEIIENLFNRGVTLMSTKGFVNLINSHV